MVPEGWRDSLLDDVATRRSGHTPDKTKPEYWNGGIKWVSLADSSKLDDGIISATDKEISELGLRHSSAVMLPKGTVVLSRDAGVGKSAILGDAMAVSQHFIAWACSEKNKLDQWFLYYWMQMQKPLFERMAVGSTIKTIGLPFFKKLRITHPPLAEQKRIAEVLGVWDRAIEVAGKQLDLARTQKRALMQTLLTPTRRFPGYEGQPWKEVRLGDVGIISSAGVDKKTNPSEPEVRLLNFLDVFRRDFLYNKEFDHVVTAPTTKVEQCNVLKGDVFFTPSSETRDDLARSAVAMEDMPGVVYSYHVVRFRLTDDWDMNFRAFVFQSDRFQRQAYEKGDGSGQRYVISQSNFRDMTVFVPGKAEQALIGATLKAAADEITTLETQITRLQAEKKALMQQLLTGQKRLAV